MYACMYQLIRYLCLSHERVRLCVVLSVSLRTIVCMYMHIGIDVNV